MKHVTSFIIDMENYQKKFDGLLQENFSVLCSVAARNASMTVPAGTKKIWLSTEYIRTGEIKYI